MKIGQKVRFSKVSGNETTSVRTIVGVELYARRVFYVLDGLPGSLFIERSLEAV